MYSFDSTLSIYCATSSALTTPHPKEVVGTSGPLKTRTQQSP